MTSWRLLRDWQVEGVQDKLHLAMFRRSSEHDQIDCLAGRTHPGLVPASASCVFPLSGVSILMLPCFPLLL